MYNDPNCKLWTSRLWAPVGYSSHYDLVQQTKAAEARKPFTSRASEEDKLENGGKVDSNEKSGMGVETVTNAASNQGEDDVKSGYNSGMTGVHDHHLSVVGTGAMASEPGTGVNNKGNGNSQTPAAINETESKTMAI